MPHRSKDGAALRAKPASMPAACPNCGKVLSIGEVIERFCCRCVAPTAGGR